MHQDHAWGIVDLCINQEMLNLGKIALDSCSALFHDGTFYQSPGQDQLPTPLDVPPEMVAGLVYLGLPVPNLDEPTISLDNESPFCRYQSKYTHINNTIDGDDEPCEARIATLKPQLLLEHDNLDAYTCIPILKINEIRSNRMIVIDRQFMFPTVNVNANVHLQQFLQECHSLVQHRADMLADRLANSQQSASTEIADFMLLQLMNRHEPFFVSTLKRCTYHPEALYQHLIQLIGELSTFTQDSRRPSPPPPYIHKAQNATFEPIMNALREALCMVLEQNAHAITLTEHEYGVWTGTIDNEELLEKSNFILAVHSTVGQERLNSLFASQVKISSPNTIKQLVSRALPGINIEPLAVAPRQIPYHANFSYFLINRSHEFWQDLKNAKQIALHVGGHFPELKLELWAING